MRPTCLLVLLLGVAVSRNALAQTPAEDRSFSVVPGAWQNTGIQAQPGDVLQTVVTAGLGCRLCGQYPVVASVGTKQYTLNQAGTVPVTEGGTVLLAIAIPAAQAQSWQGAYQVRIVRYAAAPGTPTPTPPSAQLPFIAWTGTDCARLKTEGVLASSFNPALPGGMGSNCVIYMEDWVVNSDPVWVCIPGAKDNWGGHQNGIVVFGNGFQETWKMSGYAPSNWPETQPRHTGHSVFRWGLFFSARPDATSGTITVDAYQGKGCGQPTGNTQRFQIEVTVNNPTFQVNLAAVYATGWHLARAAYGGSANLPPATTLEALRQTQQNAVATGLLDTTTTTAFVIGQLTRGATSAQVASMITQVYDRYNGGLNRVCGYGNVATNLTYAYNVGYNLSLAEIAAANNFPLATFRGYLMSLRQWAQGSNIFPTQGIDEAIGYTNNANRQSAEFRSFMSGLREQLNPIAQKIATCRR
jgi:hypothetical protein